MVKGDESARHDFAVGVGQLIAAVIDNGLDLEIVLRAAALQRGVPGWLDIIAELFAPRNTGVVPGFLLWLQPVP